MPGLRVRGEQSQVRLLVGGELEQTISAVKECTINLNFKVLTEAYLGETTVRKDDLYEGIAGTFTIHPETRDVFDLLVRLRDRAQRRQQAGEPTVSLVTRIQFESGQAPLIVVPDLHFGTVPINIGGRDQYIAIPFSWEADDFNLI